MKSWPTPDEEAELLRKLREHTATASAEFAEAFCERLEDALRRQFPNVDPDWIWDAVTETFVNTVKNPNASGLGDGRSLGGLLRHSAKMDLLNRIKKESRRGAGRSRDFDVALLEDSGKEIGMEEELREEAGRLAATVLSIVKDGLSPEELAGLELLVEGEKKTDPFAAVLKLEHLPAEERTAAVKRFKDKIKLRIRRAREVHDEST